jgi:hypothetical protein
LEASELGGLTPRRSPVDDPLAAAAQRELSQMLDEELDLLPERFRRAVVLCYLEGRSTAEAAERLGCPRGTVLSRLATAREKLRVRLLRRGVAPTVAGLSWTASADAPAALVAPTVRAVVANTATPQVIDLCDGVLRAMILSKLKLTAAVLMTVGLIGGGAGWIALTPGGPGVALAGTQAKGDAPQSDQAQEQQRRVEQRAELLKVELAQAEDRLRQQENIWAKERIDARLQLAEAEIRLRSTEKMLANALPTAEELEQLRLESDIAGLRSDLSDALKKSVKGEKEPQIEKWQSSLKQAEDQLRMRREPYGHLRADLLHARRAMVTADEQISLLDRLTALERRAGQSRVEELQDRLSQVRGTTGRHDSVERKVQNLERKLDDVLRELTDLRRDLKK